MRLRDLPGKNGGSRTIYRSNSERSEGGGAQRGVPEARRQAESYRYHRMWCSSNGTPAAGWAGMTRGVK